MSFSLSILWKSLTINLISPVNHRASTQEPNPIPGEAFLWTKLKKGGGIMSFYTDKLDKIAGGKIVCTISDGKEEFGLCIQKGGKVYDLWFLQDDEGNGPGSFDLAERTFPDLF